jgi:hypothetical protein
MSYKKFLPFNRPLAVSRGCSPGIAISGRILTFIAVGRTTDRAADAR